MKIKLAILEKDPNYLKRIVSVFSTKYADKFQIYSFTDYHIALSSVESEKIDMLISSDNFDVNASDLPRRCSFAYLVESSDIDTVNNHYATCKFQKAELIYKQILSVYSENAGNIAGMKFADKECKIITFSSPCGGTGTSTVAAACALHYAARGKRVLFLNLEDFGSSDIYFSGEGQFNMSDVIFSLKSKKANLAMKLESYVKQDKTGVFFFSQASNSLDMLELKHTEKMQLISELKMTGSYDYIIVDTDFALDKEHFDVFKESYNVIMVCDGSDIANSKLSRAYNALAIMDQNSETPVANRFLLIYNKFNSNTGKVLNETEIKNIGGAPIFTKATVRQIADRLSLSDMFNSVD